MRLIDADDLCKKLNEIYDGYMLDEGCCPIEFENMVDDMQTVYNVEKVVEELEDKSQYCIPINGQAFTGIKTEYAIDIVKRGGVDD